MKNTRGYKDRKDPLNSYINNCQLDIENVPIDIIKQSISLYNHRIDEDYIYGVKLVSKDYKHMFSYEDTPPYEVGKTYYYDESDDEFSKFNLVCSRHKLGAHGAGLWAYPCVENSVTIYKTDKICVPILVKFPLKSTIVMGNYAIKGKVMEVVSREMKDVEKYIKEIR